MIADIDAGTALAIAALASGVLAGVKVAVQSFFAARQHKASNEETAS